MNTAFLTKLASAETKVTTKGGTGSRTSAHEGDVYINKQGRMFGLSEKHGVNFDIENGEVDGVKFIKVRLAQSNGKDKNGKPTYAKTCFKTSAESTGTPFITVSKLCRELFGDDKENWAREFQKQGDQDGYTYYTLMETSSTKVETVKKTESDKKENVKETKKSTK